MNFAFDSEAPGGLVEPQRAGGLTEIRWVRCPGQGGTIGPIKGMQKSLGGSKPPASNT